MRHRLSVTVFLLVALLTLAPLAYASPPDATWIGGFYDNGDGDDVVFAVCGMDVTPRLATLTLSTPLEIVVGAVLPAIPGVFSRAPLYACVVRAPPAA
jgi:hypothetical protein